MALSAAQYSDRLLFHRCFNGTVCCAVQRKIAVLPVLQWHCLLCSTAIDCCSAGVTVAQSAVQYCDRLLFYWCYSGTVCLQYSDRLLLYRCYSGTVCRALQRLIALLLVLQWHCLLCSIAIDCCSTGVTVALSAVQYSDRLLFYLRHKMLDTEHSVTSNTVRMEEPNIGPQFRSVSTHSSI